VSENRFYEHPILLTSAGRIGVIEADGSAEKFFDLDELIQPAYTIQASWGMGPVLPDQQRIILTSYEDTTISKLVVGEIDNHLWIYDFLENSLQEILLKERPARSVGCAGIINPNQFLLTALVEGENRLFVCNLKGEIIRELTNPGEGFVYGIHLSPDQRRVAFHITGSKNHTSRYHAFRPGPYAINVVNVNGKNRRLVAGQPGHLYFDPVWSPNGEWLAYLDCHEEKDPAHFAADLCICKADGSENRLVTTGQSHWFGTSYGSQNNRGGGSNTTQWSPDGQRLLYTRLMPGSHADCLYDPSRPDHEELVYQPNLAKGGSQLCTINPFTGDVVELTKKEEGKWEHHASYTQDGSHIVYGKAYVSKDSELWIMQQDGRSQRLLTKGIDNRGAWGYGLAGQPVRIPKE
jgi:hypothetical protein